MTIEILYYIIPTLIVAFGWFYSNKKKKEIIETLWQIRELAKIYMKATEDGTITKEEMKELLDQILIIIEIWAINEK